MPAAFGPTTAVICDQVSTVIGSGPKQRKPDRVTDSIRTGLLPLGRSGERVSALAQDCEISPVTENTAPLAASDLLDDAEPLQIGERRIDRWGRETRLLNELVGRQIGILLKLIVETQRRASRSLCLVIRSRSSLNSSTCESRAKLDADRGSVLEAV